MLLLPVLPVLLRVWTVSLPERRPHTAAAPWQWLHTVLACPLRQVSQLFGSCMHTVVGGEMRATAAVQRVSTSSAVSTCELPACVQLGKLPALSLAPQHTLIPLIFRIVVVLDVPHTGAPTHLSCKGGRDPATRTCLCVHASAACRANLPASCAAHIAMQSTPGSGISGCWPRSMCVLKRCLPTHPNSTAYLAELQVLCTPLHLVQAVLSRDK